MEVTPLLTALVNAGGLGLLAAVLFYLHINALRTFREELASERTQCREDHDKLMSVVKSHHQVIMEYLLRQRRHPKPEEGT